MWKEPTERCVGVTYETTGIIIWEEAMSRRSIVFMTLTCWSRCKLCWVVKRFLDRFSQFVNFLVLCVLCYLLKVLADSNSDGKLCDFCDGSFFKEREFFRLHPTALQVSLYYDDLEICYPLGSNVKKHKLGGVERLHPNACL